MKNKFPKISVIIAAYDSERTIEKCLISIKKQTYPNIETIVVDSLFYNKERQITCKKIITKYAKYFQDGPERSVQRNRGIKEAEGEFILVIDQDMYLTTNVVNDCYEKLTDRKYIALTIPEISIGEGFWTKCVSLERYITIVLEKGLNECSRFFRKKNVQEIGGYDPKIVGVEDSDLHYRMASRGKIGKIKSRIYHDEGKTKFWGRVKKKYYYSIAFREYLKRYPNIAIKQFSPFKKAYLMHWKLLVKNPVTTGGIILLRSAEVVAGFLGVIFRRKTYAKK